MEFSIRIEICEQLDCNGGMLIFCISLSLQFILFITKYHKFLCTTIQNIFEQSLIEKE